MRDKAEILRYKGKYIPKNLLMGLFKQGNHIYVDKVTTGSGATTTFLETPSSSENPLDSYDQRGLVDILIAPNITVIKEKEKKYSSWHNGMSYGYFHSQTQRFGSPFDYNKALFVTDSFIYMMDNIIIPNAWRIGRILIDESHTIDLGVTFRKSLVLFNEKVDSLLSINPNIEIMSITATPLYGSHIDYVLLSEDIKPTNIYLKSDWISEGVDKIHQLLADGEKVIVGTNNIKVIKALATEDRHIKAVIKTGESLKGKIAQNFIVEPDTKENLIITSSAGFEGWDLNSDKPEYWAFFFEDRNSRFEKFSTMQMYQFISRARAGVQNAFYFRLELEATEFRHNKFLPSRKEIMKFLNTVSCSEISKSSRNYKINNKPHKNKYYRWIVFDKATGRARFNESLYISDYNELMHDKNIMDMRHDDFFKLREIVIMQSGNSTAVKVQERGRGLGLQSIRNNLFANRDFIKSQKLFNINDEIGVSSDADTDYRINLSGLDVLDLQRVTRVLEIYEACINYNRPQINYKRILLTHGRIGSVTDYREHSQYSNNFTSKSHYDRVVKLIELFRGDGGGVAYDNLITDIVKTQWTRNEEKYAKNHTDKKSYRFKKSLWQVKNFNSGVLPENKEIRDKVIEMKRQINYLLLSFANKFISPVKNMSGYRDYNVFTAVSIKTIKIVAEFFDMTVDEWDIRTCNPRIAYAVNKLPLPEDFYGENKENKVSINVLFNSIRFKGDFNNKDSIYNFKSRKKKISDEAGIDEKVFEWLFDNFHLKYQDEVFNFFTKHEAQIISQLNEVFYNNEKFRKFDGFFRRHDSIIVMNPKYNRTEVEYELTKFEYLGQSGWFLKTGEMDVISKKDENLFYTTEEIIFLLRLGFDDSKMFTYDNQILEIKKAIRENDLNTLYQLMVILSWQHDERVGRNLKVV